MFVLFLKASLLILVLVSLLWGVSVLIKDVSIVDLFWGPGFVVVNAFYAFASDGINLRKMVLLGLVTIWGMRLFIYLARRNLGKGEDYRYQAFRKKYGPERYWWFSYFQTFLLQGALIMIVSLPLLGVNGSPDGGVLNMIDYLGILLWLIGFVFEAGGDYQLATFKNDPSNKGKVMDQGFWRYTRHPNYFGDAVVWWAYALFSVAAGGYWQPIGSVVMTLLIIKISGVALLERSLLGNKTQYSEYVRKTSSFFPWFPRK